MFRDVGSNRQGFAFGSNEKASCFRSTIVAVVGLVAAILLASGRKMMLSRVAHRALPSVIYFAQPLSVQTGRGLHLGPSD